MKDLFDKANRLMRTANDTMYNAKRTKQNVDQINKAGKDAKKQKEASSALEWKCVCGKKNTTKFCADCGKSKPVCPKCGADETGSKFCPECGAAIN